jgi:pyrimidine-nucleoside phosphorylase
MGAEVSTRDRMDRFDRIPEIVEKKESGQPNTAQELATLVSAVVQKATPEENIIRWLRAVKKNDMLPDELAAYTLALANSGRVMNWGASPSAAKHAPGGVGENTTGPIDAIVAACGVYAPIYTGRRLEHTPGTVDRYGSIPGFKIFLEANRFEHQMHELGIAMTGQTPDCAPGDGKIYALREEYSKGRPASESLVEVPALIIGSVLGKKIASGAKNFGMLLSYGDGAFLTDYAQAVQTAERMQAVAGHASSKLSAVPTSFDAPLGDYLATTSLAVREGIKLLRNEGVAPDFREAVLRVSSVMLLNAGTADSLSAARALAESTLTSGAALARFAKFIEAQGGDPRICDDPAHLPHSQYCLSVLAPKAGYIRPHTRTLGEIANRLANGEFGDSSFDPGAGIVLTRQGRYGADVKAGNLIAVVHGGSLAEGAVHDILEKGLIIQDTPPPALERFGQTILA